MFGIGETRRAALLFVVGTCVLLAGGAASLGWAQDGDAGTAAGPGAVSAPADDGDSAAGAEQKPPPHAWGAWSLVPPLMAIGLAILTRRVIAALLVAVFAGALILHNGDFLPAIVATCEEFLWPTLADSDNLRVFAFTLLMAAMVGVMHRAGGMHGLVERVSPWARNQRRGQLTGWFLGVLIFFDDYANTLLLGHTMRPITDRLKISREKLAYIVDSTAAPVAGLAVVSTWVAIEIEYINQGFESLPIARGDQPGFEIFVETLVYRYYPWLALAFVGVVAWLGRDFGPMLTAERRAARGGNAGDEKGAVTHPDAEGNPALEPDPPPHHWEVAVVPVLVVVGAVLGLIVLTGRQKLLGENAEDPSLWDYIVNGNSYVALVYGALAGLLTAIVLGMARGRVSGAKCRAAAAAGAQIVLPALAILWLASAVRAVTDDEGGLDTGNYLALLMADVSATWLPTLIFLTSAIVAFATGTSWGTMGILTPLAIKVTYQLLADDGTVDAHDPIMLACVGSVLAGAIFGDHCSPISDTTVLSSLASHCHHIAHVRTQLPYALLVAGVGIAGGTIPAGLGISFWTSAACMLGCVIVLAILLRLMGRPSATEEDAL